MKQVFMWAVVAVGTLGASQAQAGSGRASYDRHTGAMVTAARNEPIGTVLRVTNPQNGRSVVVTVNDRGPFSPPGRVLDLSTGAFAAIYGGLGRGQGPVEYEVISRGEPSSRGGSPRLRWRHSSKHRHHLRHR